MPVPERSNVRLSGDPFTLATMRTFETQAPGKDLDAESQVSSRIVEMIGPVLVRVLKALMPLGRSTSCFNFDRATHPEEGAR